MQSQALQRQKKIPPVTSGELLNTVLRCKWSLTVYQLIEDGLCRPGAMVRATKGLSTKVLNDCLRANVKLGILNKHSYPEIPPRVEYQFSSLGIRLLDVISQLYIIQTEIEG